MHQLLLPIIFAASVLAAGPVSLPSRYQICKRSAPEFNDCLKSACQSAVKELIKGDRSLGVLPIDPLMLTALNIDQSNQGSPVAVTLNFKDLLIHGIGKITVDSAHADLDGDVKTLRFEISTPHSLILEGKYVIDGKVLVLSISGVGDSKIELLGAHASITFTGKTVVKDGETYLIFSAVEFLLEPKNATLHFDNLFNGDKALGDNMNKFLNEQWVVVYGELKDAIQKAFAATFSQVANRIFSKVPYENIFPQ